MSDGNKLLSQMDCSCGSPMGRRAFTDQTDGSVRLFRVRLIDGGYDVGGAYWGGGQPLYAAIGDGFQWFIRANNRGEARNELLRQYPSVKVRRSAFDKAPFLQNNPSETFCAPVEIAPNNTLGVRVADHWVTVDFSSRDGRQARTRYRWSVLFPDGTEESDDDLQSGCGRSPSRSEMLGTLLSFLGAAAESRHYREQKGQTEIDPDSNEGLFPPKVVDFASANSDEISMLQWEIEDQLQTLVNEKLTAMHKGT